MTKVIEETWHASVTERGDVLIENEDNVVIARVGEARNDQARAALVACAPEALRLLLEAELYATKHGNTACCPWCSGGEPYHGDKHQHATHAEDCAWAALMKKAGLR